MHELPLRAYSTKLLKIVLNAYAASSLVTLSARLIAVNESRSPPLPLEENLIAYLLRGEIFSSFSVNFNLALDNKSSAGMKYTWPRCCMNLPT